MEQSYNGHYRGLSIRRSQFDSALLRHLYGTRSIAGLFYYALKIHVTPPLNLHLTKLYFLGYNYS